MKNWINTEIQAIKNARSILFGMMLGFGIILGIAIILNVFGCGATASNTEMQEHMRMIDECREQCLPRYHHSWHDDWGTYYCVCE